jgi:hypothetical protein
VAVEWLADRFHARIGDAVVDHRVLGVAGHEENLQMGPASAGFRCQLGAVQCRARRCRCGKATKVPAR